LLKSLTDYFNKAPTVLKQRPLAIIVPHAGYVFSGVVAAAGYKQIDRDAVFKHIFLIGSSHTMYFDGASAYSIGDFITPLGKVKVDSLTELLVRKYSFISNDVRPHVKEHGLEVQLPFLQYWLRKPFSIVPIIIGGESPETCRKLGAALAPYLNSDNLFVISTDFSHYPAYTDSNISDAIMADAVLKNSTREFLKAKYADEGKNTPNLVTAMCGWTSVLTLLNITEKHPELEYRKILHRNSGDSEYGDKVRVVGYYAIGLTQKKNPDPAQFSLTSEDKINLLKIARQTIVEYVRNNKIPVIDKKLLSPNLMTHTGAFVTLTEKGTLRGCIGNFQPSEPLYSVVQLMAIAAATQDSRFDPVTSAEINRLHIEISVLTPLKKIKSIDEIKLGTHGIYIQKGNRSGTFLPQVANETHWTKEEFLGHCAEDKAQIGWNGWKDADIYIFEALVFGE
ncbi:MAG: AmmeMemoRadiSam system protein B, partial [Bacteroidota bacterium]|nr:AmmeMemoRadiSam system protein B [Bacteroidota bacterium]